MSCDTISPEFAQIDFNLYNYIAVNPNTLIPHPPNVPNYTAAYDSNNSCLQQITSNCINSINGSGSNFDLCTVDNDLSTDAYYPSPLQPNTPPYYFDKLQTPMPPFRTASTVNNNLSDGNNLAYTHSYILQEDNFSIATATDFNNNNSLFTESPVTVSTRVNTTTNEQRPLLFPYLSNATPSPQLSNLTSSYGCNSSSGSSEPAFSRRNTYHDISVTTDNGLLIAPVVKGNALPYPTTFSFHQQPSQYSYSAAARPTTNAATAAATANVKIVNNKGLLDAASDKKHVCPICNHRSKRKHNLIEHMLTHNPHRPKSFLCSYCTRPFARKYDMKRHEKIHIRRYRSSC
ncbi:hypothetical protein BDF20DRAFT_913800 [Mycotypha africana]|uniref:uncharacterized protein n=1 Tax=Mycotypha africana TaxID=64632 RepID=UPI002301B9A6|nr:uncharacterized protein BDF20DRAFT_913800 [Mycotypha africana]KAI8977474.1 hypothetical protein BDF20DRAFT_913800 [Mycotypha africana]